MALWKAGLIAAAIAILGIIPCLGLPGAVWLGISTPFVAILFPNREMPSDGAWPFAIIVTLVWPIGIPLAYYLVYRTQAIAFAPRWLGFAAVVVIWSLAATVALYGAFVPAKN